MAIEVRAVYQDVIEEYQHVPAQVRPEHIVHQRLEGRWCIRQSKWHNSILIVSVMHSEGGFGSVFFLHPNFM